MIAHAAENHCARGGSLGESCHLLRVVLVQAPVFSSKASGTAHLYRSGGDAEILVQVRIETLMRQNQELVSRNSALEMRNTVLEKPNAELTTQHRNDVIRIHAIEKEVSCPSRDMGPGFSRPEFSATNTPKSLPQVCCRQAIECPS